MRRNLLGPLHRRIHRVRPAHRIVVVAQRAAQLVNHREQEGKALLDAIASSGHFVGSALQTPFGTRAVITHHEDDKRVVRLPGLIQSVEQATDVMVSV
jgi:hypothetical protein